MQITAPAIVRVMEHSSEWARLTDLPGSAVSDVLSVLKAFEANDAGQCRCDSTVAEGGAPFELSVSSNDPKALRLLSEVKVYGESLIGNMQRNISFLTALTPLHGMTQTHEFTQFLQVLTPPGELLGQLQWKFSFYTAMRTTGHDHAIRCYFNLLWGTPEQRFVRVIEALRFLGRVDLFTIVQHLSGVLAAWGEVVGISCDIREGVIVPAKIHFSIHKRSPYRLGVLMNWMGLSINSELVRDFLSLHPLQSIGSIPYLFSVGLEQGPQRSLKIDAVLRGLPSDTRDEIVSLILRSTDHGWLETKLREVESNMCNGSDAPAKQYVGLSCNPGRAPYVNVYFSVPQASSGNGPLDVGFEQRALDAIRMIQSESGAFEFETVDFSSRRRPVPAGGGDIYMTSLVQQCLNAYWEGAKPWIADQCIAFVRSRQEGDGWRYLPELPLDTDDTAMAMISLRAAGQNPPPNMTAALLRQQLESGGFRTFYFNDSDPEHFAVTANAVNALWYIERSAARAGLGYIDRWMREPRWQELQWMYSGILPMYLLARTASVFNEYAPDLQNRIVEFLCSRRRGDGLWGNGNPECVETALAALALDCCGVRPNGMRAIVDFLRDSQCSDGTWPWAPLYSDGDGQWFGQRAASTILCCSGLRLSSSLNS